MIVRAILKSKFSNDVASTIAEQSVLDAAKMLHEKKIGAVMVLDASKNIMGILSERDIARGVALHGDTIGALRVRDLMTKTVQTCSPDDSLEKIMEVMTSSRIRHLPVVEQGKLIGMISIGDVVKSRLADTAMQMESMREYVMAAR